MDIIYLLTSTGGFLDGALTPPSYSDPSIYISFTAGLLSFLSPCVLPLIPIYLSLISGVSLDQLQSKDRGKGLLLKTVSTSLVFILGFSTVFFLLGATATVLGSAMDSAKDIIAKVLAVFIFIFGLHFIGVYRFKFLAFEKKFEARAKPMNYISIYLVGLAFAFGWTPCVGPLLSTVSTMAWTSGTVGKGVVYLLAYSLGIAIPFLLTAIAFNYLLGVFSWIKRHFRIIEIISGSLLVIVAILIFMGWMNKISTLLVPQEDTEMSTGFESVGQMDYEMPADYQMDTDSTYELEMSEDSNPADTLK